MVLPADYVWLNGEIVPWVDGKIHINTMCVLGGINAYDVFRGYWNEDEEEMFLFKVDEHLERLERSMKVMRLSVPYSREDLKQAAIEVIRANQFREDISVRYVIYAGQGALFGFRPEEIETGAFILPIRAPISPAVRTGLNCCVSSWQRLSDLSQPPRVKSGANYQNVRFAQMQAVVDGYDEAILLNQRGKVAEAPLRNVFLVRNGVPITPSITSGILEGVTRQTIIELFKGELGLEVVEREVDRTELYVADEVFLTSTTTEAVPVISIDRYPVADGRAGRLTQEIYRVAQDATRGRNPRYQHWLTPVYKAKQGAAASRG